MPVELASFITVKLDTGYDTSISHAVSTLYNGRTVYVDGSDMWESTPTRLLYGPSNNWYHYMYVNYCLNNGIPYDYYWWYYYNNYYLYNPYYYTNSSGVETVDCSNIKVDISDVSMTDRGIRPVIDVPIDKLLK